MNTFKHTFVRHPLTWFFVLAYILSWWSAPLAGGALIPYGPMVAAIIVLLMMGGRQALVRAWRANTPAPVPWQWVLIASGIALAIHLGTLVLLYF
jgi:hypothetical protein